MRSSPDSSVVGRAGHVCATCARGVRDASARYRELLLEPGTLFTLLAGLLLIAAIIVTPSGVFSDSGKGAPLYVASALVGSAFIWFSALQGIREHDFTADIPVSVATAAAMATGQFSAAAIVAVLLLVGGLLEELVAARANHALDALEALLPSTVTVRRLGGDVTVALDEVCVGEIVLIRPGERIAIDGVVMTGDVRVNQAAITGESVPVAKAAGDEVYAGTLSSDGALEVRAVRVGEETTLGQIRRMVSEAQERKAPIERILDRYAKLYTPAALALALILWLGFGDITRAITVLIVFCPCVMVLATPTALVASIGNAALRGSLVKQGATIEALEKIDTVCFDKTGTLTFGEPRLLHTIVLDGLADGDLLRLAASAEKFSEHPLAQAVVQAAHARRLHVEDPLEFSVLPGLGVRALTTAGTLLVGRPDLLADQGVALDATLRARAEHLAAPGATVVAVALDERPAGLLVLQDALRADAQSTVARLNELGVRTVLVTGDNEATAQRIAAQVGLTEVHAGVLPARKAQIVQQLQSQGRSVAFVGDGINDAPALAVADVGVAMGAAGTDLAIQTAQVSLLSDQLDRLPHLLTLSRAALHAIRQNLVFSLGVLVIAVGLSIAGILHPVTGALLHELSSIPVIANSARLIRRRG